MDQHRWKKVNRIVDTALQLEEPERQTYIDQECEGNRKLYRQVTELLQSIEESDTKDFLDTDSYPTNLITSLSEKEPVQKQESPPSLVGQKVDNYKITSLINHGGMGSVFLAKRADESYQKKVALKILRRGMDTPSNIARFKRERNILARLKHSNIARLLDGGMTPEGLPYLVMEYVEGTPLYEYCDNNKLTIQERITLFKSICEAVQHAHNNAIIHRDLKPSNILVTQTGKIKILDFGIAKLLEPKNPDNLFETQTGSRILTLGYAAPEQLNDETVTTATDTYVLGILLFELLAGVPPFELEGNLEKIERVVRKQEPSKPSVRFRNLQSERQNKIAGERSITPSKLCSKLAGDLDAIIRKALRKEPESRYSAVTQLVDDLERCEENRPVIARRDTLRYHLFKYINRHKVGLTVAAGILLLITGFGLFYTQQITQERNKAKQEAKKAQQVSDFLVDIFESGNPIQSKNAPITAGKLLEKGIEDVSQLTDRPAVQAEMLDAMGRAEVGLGNYQKADSLLNRALSIRRQLYEPPHPDLATSFSHRARALRNLGDFAAAESLARKAVEMRTILRGQADPKVAESLHELAFSLKEQGKFASAESLYREALKIQQAVHEGPNKEIASTLTNLGQLLTERGEYVASDSIHHHALTMRRKLWGDIHPKIAESLNNLAQVRERQGYLTDAESLYRKALKIDKMTLGTKHPETIIDINNLAVVIERQGHLAEAESLKRRSLTLRREILGADHPDVTTAMNNLAVLLRKKGKYEEAASLFRRVLERLRRQFEEGHPYIAFTTGNLGDVLREQGRYAMADSLYKSALTMIKNAFHDRHPHVAATLERLARLREAQNRYMDAEQYQRKALSIRREAQGNHPETAESMKDLADLLLLQGKPDKAEKQYRETLSIYNKNNLDSENSQIAILKSTLGESLIKQGDYREAEPLLKEAATSMEKQGTPDHQIRQTYQRLADLYDAWGKTDLAATYRDTLSR